MAGLMSHPFHFPKDVSCGLASGPVQAGSVPHGVEWSETPTTSLPPNPRIPCQHSPSDHKLSIAQYRLIDVHWNDCDPSAVQTDGPAKRHKLGLPFEGT